MAEFNSNYPQQQQQYGNPQQHYGGNNSQQQYMGNYPQQQQQLYGGNYPQQQPQPQWGSYPNQQHQGHVEPPAYVDDSGDNKGSRTYVANSGWRSGTEAEGQDERFSGFSDKVCDLDFIIVHELMTFISF